MEAAAAEPARRRDRDDQQDNVLRHIETGEVLTAWEVTPRLFFNLLVETTAEGFYSDPQQGGNLNGVSWVMTGFEDASARD